MKYSADEIIEVVRMLSEEDLDIRSVTLSVNTLQFVSDDVKRVLYKLDSLNPIFDKFSSAVNRAAEKYGVKIVTRRVAITPIQFFLEALNQEDGLKIALKLEDLAETNRIDYIGGYSAFAVRWNVRKYSNPCRCFWLHNKYIINKTPYSFRIKP